MGDEWLAKYIMSLEQRLASLDSKVDQLLRFKWQIIGGSLVASVFITATLQLIFSISKHG